MGITLYALILPRNQEDEVWFQAVSDHLKEHYIRCGKLADSLAQHSHVTSVFKTCNHGLLIFNGTEGRGDAVRDPVAPPAARRAAASR